GRSPCAAVNVATQRTVYKQTAQGASVTDCQDYSKCALALLLQGFLKDINAGVDKEPLTGPWFALRYSKTTFCIFEAFPDAEARHTHDHGPGGQNFLRSELLHDMLAYPAQLYRLDVLHGKFGVMLGQPIKPA